MTLQTKKNNKDQKIPRNKVPRIIYLKMLYGDDFMDYIKDDYGTERFIKEQLDKDIANRIFFETNQMVKEFAVQWLVFTDYYKNRFGQGVRDIDAVEKLKCEKIFSKIEDLYNFRCRLFKSDFHPNNKFSTELKSNIKYLKKLNKYVFKKRTIRNLFLIENKEW
jgi:hypothetical protein